MAKHIRVEVRMVGNNLALVPADPYAYEVLDGLNREKTYEIEVKNSRRLGSLREWWAGLGYAVQRWEGTELGEAFPSSRKLNDALLIWLGFTETIHTLLPGGRLGAIVKADSISFEAIDDEDEFKALMEKAAVEFIARFGFDPWQEWKDAKAREKAMSGQSYKRRDQW